MALPARSGGVYGGFDLADFVNRDALRLRRTGGGEPFTLETSLSTSSPGFTYLSGLYLFSNDGYSSNDLVFGANNSALKIDRGSASQSGMPGWSSIGAYGNLYLQVVYDGASSYNFNYKKAAGDSWSPYWSTSGYSFDQVGIITKTWYL